MLVAYHLAKDALPEFTSKFSRKDFTKPQLFACLVLKEFERKDYRGAEQLLWDWPEARRAIGLAKAPDHTTLHRAAKVLLCTMRARKLLDRLVEFARACRVLGKSVALAALDSSGFETRHISSYFVRRRAKGGVAKKAQKTQETTYSRFPKLGVVVDCATHLVLSFWAGLGPGADHGHFDDCLYHAWRRAGVRRLVADAGYDSEDHHDMARRDMGVKTFIPPLIGRPRKDGKPPGGRWRRVMARLLRTKRGRRKTGYTQRWQSETANSMMKRNAGSALRARSDAARNREFALRVLTHNLGILRVEDRNRARHIRFCGSGSTIRPTTRTESLIQRISCGLTGSR
jgi:Transposase DDE domain